MKFILIGLVSLVFLSACNETKTSSTAPSNNSKTRPLFKVGDQTMTRADLPRKMQEMIYQNNFEAYSKNENVFKEYALRVFLAKKNGKFTDLKSLPELSELLPIPEPTEAEMKKLFNEHKARMPKGVDFKKMKPQIAGYIKGQKMASVFKAEVTKMESAGDYRSFIATPMSLKFNLDLTGHPVYGNSQSKVTVVEISDYTCGHCQRAHHDVKQLLEKYKSKIKFVQMNYSLRPNGLSGAYVKGAYCAAKQGIDKFWTYHHNAFEHATKPHDHSAPGHSHEEKSPEDDKKSVLEVATKSQLEGKSFESCFANNETLEFILKTSKLLNEQGINGTPTFLVNGTKVMGGVAEVESMINKML